MAVPILIVGAGPTGLMLALQLRRRGAAFRIVSEAAGPGEQSRALVVHARTLEFYRQLGLAERMIAAGTKIDMLRVRERGEEIAAFSLKEMGAGLSPYPFALCLPQDEHERLLVEALATDGVAIEWGTKLARLDPRADGVTAILSGTEGEERAEFAWIAGCDGAHSRVREAMRVDFAGGHYDRLYYVADVRPRERPGDGFVVALDPGDFALRLPARKGENERLIGYVPESAEAHPGFDDVRADAERLLGIGVAEVNWFSTYRVQHRVAGHFRAGRCFLLGDAGHLHSPVGGQGMNTGIGDAVNLGWKLAAITQGEADASLLDSYEIERIGFARALVATTDRAFRQIADSGLRGRLFRGWIMPHVIPAAMATASGRRIAFRLLSQTRIAYRRSPLSKGRAGQIAGGDRLPWVEGLDNFEPLAALGWQLHAFGDAGPEFANGAAAMRLPLHRFSLTDAARKAGFARGAVYLVRPDGHVALAMSAPDMASLRAYGHAHGLGFA